MVIGSRFIGRGGVGNQPKAAVCCIALLLLFPGSASAEPAVTLNQWQAVSPRDEIRPQFSQLPADSGSSAPLLVIATDGRQGLQGWWKKSVPVEGGKWYRFTAKRRAAGVPSARRHVFARVDWRDADGKPVKFDQPVVDFYALGTMSEATPEYPVEQETDSDGWTVLSGVYRAPAAARLAILELHLQWAANARAEWRDVELAVCQAPAGRRVRLAAVHFSPHGKTPAENCRQFEPLLAEAARQNADLVVLPETLTLQGTGLSYADVAEPIPGPSTEYFGGLARQHHLALVIGLVERDGHLIYNVAVLIGPDGKLSGKYRKVCLPRTEIEAGVTPGHEYPVFSTPWGKVGMMICYDGFFPEVARALANRGAEVIAFPVAGCNPQLVSARACENHVYLVSSTYTDVAQQWTVTGIYDHQGKLLQQARRWGTIAVAEVDLDRHTRWANLGDFKAQLPHHRPGEDAGQQPAIDQPPADDGNPGAQQGASARPAPAEPSLRIPPRAPAEALQSFQVQDGFRLELLAAEPLVTDPVAMVYDEQGAAFVAEMNDYPYTDKVNDRPFEESTKDQPLGRIRKLEDLDGNGTFERSIVFADELSWPTGLALWQGGLFVVATPDLWYLKDTDGDGRADVRQKIVSGFRKFNVQAVVNNLAWGLDHWIYGAGGTNGGLLVAAGPPESAPLKMSVNDFRLDPPTQSIELLTGGARFGQAFDDWGNRFIGNIRNPIQHVVLAANYLARNRFLPVRTAIHDVAAFGDTIAVYRASRPEPWRIRNAARLAADPAGFSPRSETVSAGYLTSACGVTVYRGAAYPPQYAGQVFLAEPAANLVHRQTMHRDGVTFRAERADEQVEFATSTDNWFRPVNFVNAPDGTLHVLDMYRETIEHPWSIPDDIKAGLDLRSGHDRGRIYRLAPPGFTPPPPPRLATAPTAELVELLVNPNSWWRETAHRLIYERQDKSIVPRLRALLSRSPQERPSPANRSQAMALGRVHALWSLDGLEALETADLVAALNDPEPGVRTNAVRLAEPRLSGDNALLERLTAMADDPDIGVRFQVALSLGSVDLPAAHRALVQIAIRDAGDRWMRSAVLSAPPATAAGLAAALLATPASQASSGHLVLLRNSAQVAGAVGSSEVVAPLLEQIGRRQDGETSDLLASEALLGLADGLSRQNKRLADVMPADSPAARRIASMVAESARHAADHKGELAGRRQAVELLALSGAADIRRHVVPLLTSAQPPELQLAALSVVAGALRSEAPQVLVSAYPRLSPAVRAEAVQTLLSRPEWSAALVAALDRGEIPAAEIPRNRRAPLLRHADARVRDAASAIFARDVLSPRAEVVAAYRQALSQPSNLARGRQVFGRACRSCHRLDGEGFDVGPSLATVRHRTKEELLLSVLDPNREVTPEFVEYVLTLRDGRIVSGAIAAETPASITLRRAEGASQTVLRQDIEEMSTSGKSIMPEGFEKQLSLQEMADLLTYLSAGN